MGILEEIKLSFRKGNIVFRLIYINLALFVAINVIFVILRLSIPGITLDELRMTFSDKFLKFLMVPSLPGELIRRPWTIITYMFTHFNFFHILFNLLMLYWFGKIFLQYFTEKQLLSTYLLGGIAGAILFLILLNGFPGLRQNLGTSMLGASAAIMAIVIGIAFYVPDYTIYLMFLGPVRLKYIALFMLVLDVMMIASYNAGGHIAHLGGALYGYYHTRQFRQGKDIGKWLNDLLDNAVTLFKPRSRLNVTHRNHVRYMSDEDYNKRKAEIQREIDRILDKIAQSGYESLTRQEKETLFKMNKDNK
ncbi:MAG: rhomboid family intramembrane serine protease [Bacteroidales bacterium]|nr:rhomboid family intramembrane serine protease [Bacteroidales bacterium]